MLISDHQPQDARWSKDHVEHLRTVHFTLLSTSIGLIIFTFCYQPERVHFAMSQLDGIINFSASVTSYPLTYATKQQEDESKGPLRDSAAVVQDLGTRQRDLTFSSPAGGEITIRFPKGLAIPFAEISHIYPLREFANLKEFEVFWNSLDSSSNVLLIDQFDSVEISRPDQREYVRMQSVKEDSVDSRKKVPVIDWIAEEQKNGFVLSGSLMVNDSETKIQIRCSGSKKSIKIRRFIARALTVPEGDFKSSFPELSEMVNENARSKPLAEIKKNLEAQPSAQPQTFDAFGMHIPADLVGQFGVFGILVLQWYLFIHINEFRGRIHTDASGWDVAWIGIYTKSAAKATFILTVAGLPPVAVIALIQRGTNVGGTTLFLFSAIFLPVVSAVVGGYTASSVLKATPQPQSSTFE
jgi:hypothetical protein